MSIITNDRVRRRYNNQPTDKSRDARDPFQRDRDRLLYSHALHRLAGVTQVSSPIEGTIVHNRLSHSLKVAQIARRLAEKLDPNASLISPDVCETAALAHDLGHPPFGHAGESVLNECMGDKVGYEGNAQTLRILTRLASRSLNREEPGLDLTRATLNATIKYPWVERTNPEKKAKWGAYEEDKETFLWVRKNGPAGHDQALEAQIMDCADDVTYAVHDLDDFYRAGLIPIHEIASDKDGSRARGQFLQDVNDRWTDKAKESVSYAKRLTEWDSYKAALSEIMELWVVDQPYEGRREQQAGIRQFTSFAIERFLRVKIDSVDGESRLKPEHSESEYEIAMLKELVWHYVIESRATRLQQIGFKRVIKTLFKAFASDEKRNLAPSWLLSELDKSCGEARWAADVVSSLTDVQAMTMYNRLVGANPGSIRDWY